MPSPTPAGETPDATAEVTPPDGAVPAATTALPTATLRLTDVQTDTPSPTLTPTASATPTARPRASNTPEVARPSLREPQEKDAGSLNGEVTFKWFYPGRLGSGHSFEVLIWPVGSPEHLGAAEVIRISQQTIDLDMLLPERGGAGEYNWSVVVVDSDNPKLRLSLEADPWKINYIGDSSSQPKPPKTATSTVQPLVTVPTPFETIPPPATLSPP